MKTKLLLLFFCFLSLNVMGQGTITRNSTRKQEPKKQKTEQPAKQNSGKKPSNSQGQRTGQRQNSKPSSQPTSKTEPKKQKTEQPAKQKTGKKQSGSQGQRVNQSSKPRTGTINGHEWVDLGLSVKWATCNVGASSPSDYGGYYAWGETTTKLRYDLDNCFDYLGHKGNSWNTYKVGGQTRITPSSGHDTARKNWGGTWRMPTDVENEELFKKCKWSWTTQGGHKGYKVTGSNGNSIFLPAAGCRDGSDTYDVGEYGFYWLSTLSSPGSNNARCIGFGSSYHQADSYSRRYGYSVRPVTE